MNKLFWILKGIPFAALALMLVAVCRFLGGSLGNPRTTRRLLAAPRQEVSSSSCSRVYRAPMQRIRRRGLPSRAESQMAKATVEPSECRFCKTVENVLRQTGKAPVCERFARLVENPFLSREVLECLTKTSHRPVVYEDDVFISGIPMIDQGNRAYCAVASAIRAFLGYGIDVTMDDFATLANASEVNGTDMVNWEDAIRKVANAHGLELKVIPELTESMIPLPSLLYEYNHTARAMGRQDLDARAYVNPVVWDYKSFMEDRDYDVQREVVLSNARKCETFADNIMERVASSDPLFWSVTLGDVPESVPYADSTIERSERVGHMRLLIGYNENRSEVIYTDSWGEGHQLKRMDAHDALSITRGVYYLTE